MVNTASEVLDEFTERRLRRMGIALPDTVKHPSPHNKVTRMSAPRVTAEHDVCNTCYGNGTLSFRFLGSTRSVSCPTCEGHGFVTRWV